MQFSTLLTSILAATAFVVATPVLDAEASKLITRDAEGATIEARGCPNGWAYCGRCNGNSCKIAGLNQGCDQGKCTKQSGAGDGAICGSHWTWSVECPGH
ncbi:hypothetical protein BGZ60DRAFT_396939 [Tricladium varicosporioides]|nr:hypothetical protein BGZ60DRAFT_396939 [Hymenoscyphus varicosporioides]